VTDKQKVKRASELIYHQIFGALIREDYSCAGYLCHALHALERGDMTTARDWVQCSLAPAWAEIDMLLPRATQPALFAHHGDDCPHCK
jgi:hypothetical protein